MRNSSIIARTSGSASRSAASAPVIANEVGFEVAWLWIDASPCITDAGPSA